MKARGITRITGKVAVDDRLFDPDPDLTTGPVPMIINDNVIDVLSKPSAAGRQATFSWRPQTSANSVSYHVQTVAAGQPSNITTSVGPNGVITVNGTLAADSKPWLAAVPIALTFFTTR